MLIGTGESISPHAVRQTSYTIPNTAGSITTMTTDANGNIVVTVTSPLLASARVDILPNLFLSAVSPPPNEARAGSTSDTTRRTSSAGEAYDSTTCTPHENTKITNPNVSRGIKRCGSHLEVSPMPVKRTIVGTPVKREVIDLVSPVRPSCSCTAASASYASTSASTPCRKPKPKPKPEPKPIIIPSTTRTSTPSPSRPKPKLKPTPTPPSTTRTSPPSPSCPKLKPKPAPIIIPSTTCTKPPSPSPSPLHTRPKIPPPINGMDKHTMFEFVDPISFTVWSPHLHKPYFWAMIGDDTATNSNGPTHFRIEFVLDTLHSVVGSDTEFVAIPASTQVPKSVSFKAPHPILVTCDSKEVVKGLVERRYIDIPNGWLCIFPKNLHPSSFIMYLRAPGVEDSPTHKAQIIKSVQARLRTIPDFRVFIENNSTDPRLLKIASKEERFEYIVNSV